MTPTAGQLCVLGISVTFFAAGGVASFLRAWLGREKLRIVAKACLYFGMLSACIVLAWHCAVRGQWQPLRNNFDALIWLALILSGFVMYIQRTRPLAGLEWFIMPIVILLLTAAGLVGKFEPKAYRVNDTWVWIHLASVFGGAVAFAVAAAQGMMYVIAARRLRNKSLVGASPFASLERLEQIMMTSVTLGFALLTLGLITGLWRMWGSEKYPPTPKLILAAGAWSIYAVVMHAPINPRFRGKRAAILSMFGFLLLVGTFVAVQFMPGRGN